MTFDFAVRVTDLIALTGFLSGGLAFAISIKNDVKMLKTRIDDVESDMHKVSCAIVSVARQDERIKNLEKRV